MSATTSNPPTPAPFALSHAWSTKHVIPQPCDLALNPPQTYLYIQDFLIVSCGILYALCYFFYMTRTYSDRYCAGTPLYLAGTMAYELYYSLVMPRSRFERVCFLVWFMFDVSFVSVALWKGYKREERRWMVWVLVVGTMAGMALLRVCGKIWKDDLEMVVAYWTGTLLELPIGWASIYLLVKRGDTKGQSLEIWVTRFLGCIAAFAVFGWRYINAPQNWAYVGSSWSLGLMAATLLPEVVYPAVYIWAHRKERETGKAKVT
ncbi:hypothetical protein DM02DRAFT_539263 [Periconia macrospinosa]|uniref:Uncharacterized protein n=1 Tax=Periconia macrospinosa TaxID=97972 RepID=A0A2V1D8W7_9PLEO|nr:hypothetical protein DM02DRAFT_539263 [Periconia macrospinosa]